MNRAIAILCAGLLAACNAAEDNQPTPTDASSDPAEATSPAEQAPAGDDADGAAARYTPVDVDDASVADVLLAAQLAVYDQFPTRANVASRSGGVRVTDDAEIYRIEITMTGSVGTYAVMVSRPLTGGDPEVLSVEWLNQD